MNTVHNNPATALVESLGAAPHPACGHLLPRAEKERLPVQVVEHLHRLLGGDARLEDVVLDYVEFRWGKRDLFYIPPKAASEIIRRPADFLTAAKNHSEPELFAEGRHFL
jgi:hypothetical protein